MNAAAVTRETLLKEAEQARTLAELKQLPSAMISATTLKAKLTGNLIEQTEDLVERERLNAVQAQRREMATAGELLANALASVGLITSGSQERDALIAARAIGNGKLPTPEMYKLLHAAASIRRLDKEKPDDDANH